jgi:hypothetical protein
MTRTAHRLAISAARFALALADPHNGCNADLKVLGDLTARVATV